jgi:hypothetical protein
MSQLIQNIAGNSERQSSMSIILQTRRLPSLDANIKNAMLPM